ncbi:hypothetical protein GO684_02185 [Wolbachia endosymbiont of Litomosoides brasiliensis]|uniref:hypothetical protein n=1 Tax=Wolbachia endosymbiont of Litomosoides brasiliensis TaxID=1812117 RepID=UPI00158F2A1C|nr:hypothetical protein [Wolbachia endosymbiont of Litomosoides brasiliensis]NUY39496.1 hypothetical protein [Wolbachia endosymbiont of Litomosoides brasiliensis]
MALKLKLLVKIVELAKEMLKEVQNNTYVAKKQAAVIAAKKHSTTAKILKKEKLFTSLQRHRKTGLSQSQFEQVKGRQEGFERNLMKLLVGILDKSYLSLVQLILEIERVLACMDVIMFENMRSLS